MTCEAFTNEFIAAIKDKRMDAFKRRYREEFDVLLIDDIHFLAGKDGIQEEFFHTFNTLHASGRQLVLTSDRAPREIPDLADRLRSRFEWGLLVDVQPPDIETRIAILHKRVAADRVRIDDPELLPAIARRVPTNIRELEGALTRVLAYASLTGRPASAALVRETLRDLPDADTPVSVATIKQVVSEAFGIPVLELESAKRSQAVVAPRQLAMYLCRELTDATLPAIGREFGGRDHTTVLYAVQKISNRLHHDRREYDQVDDLIRRIKRHAIAVVEASRPPFGSRAISRGASCPGPAGRSADLRSLRAFRVESASPQHGRDAVWRVDGPGARPHGAAARRRLSGRHGGPGTRIPGPYRRDYGCEQGFIPSSHTLHTPTSLYWFLSSRTTKNLTRRTSGEQRGVRRRTI